MATVMKKLAMMGMRPTLCTYVVFEMIVLLSPSNVREASCLFCPKPLSSSLPPSAARHRPSVRRTKGQVMRLCCLFVTRFSGLVFLGNSKAKKREREMPGSLGLRLSSRTPFAKPREGKDVAVYRYEFLGGGVGATQM